jgi:hypothetical protein
MGLIALATFVGAMIALGILVGAFNGRIDGLSAEIFYVLLCTGCAFAAILVHPRTGATTAVALATGISLVAGMLLFLLAARSTGIPWIMLAVALGGLAALVVLRLRSANDLRSSVLKSAQGIVSEALATFVALRGKATAVFAGYALSLVAQAMVIIAIYLLGHAIRIEPEPTLLQTMIAAPVAFLTGVLPLPANGIGVGEVAFDAMLAIQQPAEAGPLAGATLYLAFRIVSALAAVVGIPFFLISRAARTAGQTPDEKLR